MGGTGPSTPDASPAGASHRPVGVRVGAVVALALAAAFVAWLVWGRGGHETPAASSVPTTVSQAALTPSPSAVTRPALVSLAQLRSQARRSSVPFYWVGSRPPMHLELPRRPSGAISLPSLPAKARAGDRRPFLTVATYPSRHAFAEVKNAAKEANDQTIELAGGGIAVYDTKRPTNVHIAYPAQQYQVEV